MILFWWGTLLKMISVILFESNNNVTMSEKKLERIHCYSSGRTDVGEEGKNVSLRTRI